MLASHPIDPMILATDLADIGFALCACILDPHGTSIGLLEFKGRD